MLNLNFNPFPVLKTKRLLLRQLNAEDKQAIYNIRSNAIVNRYINRPKTNSIADAEKFIERVNDNVTKNIAVYWGITLKEKPDIIGTIVLWKISPEQLRAEIGYELYPLWHGKGIMQEAFTEVIKYGFETLLLKRIVAFTSKENEASKKLLEKNSFAIAPELDEMKTEKEKETMLIYSCHTKL